MGRIFSWEEVAAQCMPSNDDFRVVIDLLRQELPAVKGVRSAIVLGSTVFGHGNLRSDVDCLVVYEHACADEVFAGLRRLHHKAAKRFVPIEFIPVEMSLADTSMHGVSPGFFQHFRHAINAGGLIGPDPRPWFFLKHVTEAREARDYLAHKLRKFRKAFINYDGDNAERRRHTQKVLEIASHIARKVCIVLETPMPRDDKATVYNLYRHQIANAEEGMLFDRLVHADRLYSTFLEEGMANAIGRREYTRYLDELFALTPVAIDLLTLTARRLR